MVDGLLHGLWREWDDLGRLVREGAYDAGLGHGGWKIWLYGDGFPARSQGEIRHGLATGVWTAWREPEEIQFAEEHWFLGTTEGAAWYAHANGAKASEGGYRSGLRHGPWIFWYESGAKQAQTLWDDGLAQGLWQEWWNNGQLRAEGTYSSGVRKNDWQAFAADGTATTLEALGADLVAP